MGYGQNKLIAEHRPLYPSRSRLNFLYRDIGLLERARLYNTRSGEVFDTSTLNDLLNIVHDNDLFTICQDIVGLPYVYEMAGHDHIETLCTKDGLPTMACMRYKNYKRWLVRSQVWNDDATPQFTESLHNTFGYIGTGVKPSPSSVGRETMRKVWKDNRLGRYTNVSIACEDYLHDNCLGGIAVTPGIFRFTDEAILLDMKSAYPKHLRKLPCGAASYYVDGSYLQYELIWFAKCIVTIPRTLPLGPFPVRQLVPSHPVEKIQYPTDPGVYETYLWSFQAEDCKRAGCTVDVISGYGWRSVTDDPQQWVDYMYELRQSAPSDDIMRHTKHITNATIGSMGMGRLLHVLTTEYTDGDKVCFNEEGLPIELFVHPKYVGDSSLMPHWMYANIAYTNSAVYNFALPFAIEGRLLMIDYDSIIVSGSVDTSLYHEKRSSAGNAAPIGSWLYTILHNCYIPAARSYESDEEMKRPGVKRVNADETLTYDEI